MIRPTPSELRTARVGARLSQAAAGALLGVSRVSWSRWESETSGFTMPPGLWIAFRAVLESGEAARWAATLADLKSSAARTRARERLAANRTEA